MEPKDNNKLSESFYSLKLEDYTAADYHQDNYACYHFHERFLRDEKSIHGFRNAICGNKHLFQGKVTKSAIIKSA